MQTTDTKAPNLRDTDWLMQRLGITSRNTIHCWVHRRVIPFVRISKRVVRFDADEIERWIQSRRVAPCGAGDLNTGAD